MSIALATTLKPSIRRMIHRQHSAHFSTFATNRSVYEGYQAATSSNVLDYARHLELARITGAELKVFKNTGHLTHYETPAEVASYLAELLER
jgi:pimeloyl-ACP methyl ester carboxylesterase